jgi:putative FmdB family regulatory protein
MPIYEFACPKCRVVFSFLSRKVNPGHSPVCPKCGHKKMDKQMSAFAAPKGLAESAPKTSGEDEGPAMPDMDDPRIMRAMGEIERDMSHMDENNPRHMAMMMRKMKDILPANTMPKEMDDAIKRLEKGEDPEKVEQDMGDIFGGMMDGMDDPDGMGGMGGMGAGGGNYTRDAGLYDY